MLQPAPTTKIDPRLARGTFEAHIPATATKPHALNISFPNSSYQVHLIPLGPTDTLTPGQRIVGIIRARARRIDEVNTGGRYIEPVIGRPRRVQGRVVAIDTSAVVVDAGMPIHCTPTDPRQKPADFRPGQFVSFDILDGATFEAR